MFDISDVILEAYRFLIEGYGNQCLSVEQLSTLRDQLNQDLEIKLKDQLPFEEGDIVKRLGDGALGVVVSATSLDKTAKDGANKSVPLKPAAVAFSEGFKVVYHIHGINTKMLTKVWHNQHQFFKADNQKVKYQIEPCTMCREP